MVDFVGFLILKILFSNLNKWGFMFSFFAIDCADFYVSISIYKIFYILKRIVILGHSRAHAGLSAQ